VDENPLVGGAGIAALEKAGIEVATGLMEEEARAFYEGFFFAIAHKRPKIILKVAQSLDGRINHGPDEETPITGEEARMWTHRRRAYVDAVLITGKTLRADNPDLTPRLIPGAAAPEAIVLSRRGPFPDSAKLFASGRSSKTLVIGESGEGLPEWVEHVKLGEFTPKAEAMAAILALFAKRGYHSVLVEGGKELWALFLNADLADELCIITAPRFLPLGERWDAGLSQDWGNSLKFRNLTRFGSDFLAEFERSEPGGFGNPESAA
jgi:diaminohydroxyphosphoribosylaminopyrimidine deaminase/5-amino-6-(5-phosphoribosylamino)uracil reductase